MLLVCSNEWTLYFAKNSYYDGGGRLSHAGEGDSWEGHIAALSRKTDICVSTVLIDSPFSDRTSKERWSTESVISVLLGSRAVMIEFCRKDVVKFEHKTLFC